MISIVIASIDENLLANIKLNISDSIGVGYEIISIDNSEGKKGLCEIYNDAVLVAKYDLICFMHEDLCFKTKNWGQRVVAIFETVNNIGILGVAGSAYKGLAPSGWGTGGTKEVEFYHYQQRYKFAAKATITAHANFTGKPLNKAVVVDGMWFCTTKNIANKFKFDEETFKKFHCYDLDFCLSVGKQHQVFIADDILIEHFSEGGYDKGWMEETFKLHDKWCDSLPRTVENASKVNWSIERKLYKELIKRMLGFAYSVHEINLVLKKYKLKSKMSLLLYLKLKYYLFKYAKS